VEYQQQSLTRFLLKNLEGNDWARYEGRKERHRLYKTIIEMAQKEGDTTTAFIFKQILEDEENHQFQR